MYVSGSNFGLETAVDDESPDTVSITFDTQGATIRQFMDVPQLVILRDQINAALTKLQPASGTKNCQEN